jgi:hypothetical protein
MTTTLPPEPGESPFSDEDAPPASPLAVYRQIPMIVSDGAVDIDGLNATSWAQDAVPGRLRVDVKVQTRVETREHAERVESVLPGTVDYYDRRTERGGGHTQRKEWSTDLDWRLCEVTDTGEVGEAVVGCAPIRSLTLTAGDPCTLMISASFTVPLAQITAVDGLRGKRVRLVGTARQLSLPQS